MAIGRAQTRHGNWGTQVTAGSATDLGRSPQSVPREESMNQEPAQRFLSLLQEPFHPSRSEAPAFHTNLGLWQGFPACEALC